MVSAVDLLKGIAVGTGMDNIIVEGANGGLHTNYAGKVDAALKALTEGGYDFVYIHVEAPDEMGHQGKPDKKKEAVETIDEVVVKAQMIRREADRFVVDVANSDAAIGKDGTELLRQSPGVWVKDDEISINGSAGTKIFINNREIKIGDKIKFLNLFGPKIVIL